MAKKGSGKGGELPPEDEALWRIYTKDIKDSNPVFAKADLSFEGQKTQSIKNKDGVFDAPQPHKEKKPVLPQPPQLDFRTEQKLKRGKIAIDAKIDLHGFTQAQAHTALTHFVIRAHTQGMRCLLVITGKGIKNLDGNEPKRGVLKRILPQWLLEHPLKNIVLRCTPAATKDGGEGAFYVYLRRKKEL